MLPLTTIVLPMNVLITVYIHFYTQLCATVASNHRLSEFFIHLNLCCRYCVYPLTIQLTASFPVVILLRCLAIIIVNLPLVYVFTFRQQYDYLWGPMLLIYDTNYCCAVAVCQTSSTTHLTNYLYDPDIASTAPPPGIDPSWVCDYCFNADVAICWQLSDQLCIGDHLSLVLYRFYLHLFCEPQSVLHYYDVTWWFTILVKNCHISAIVSSSHQLCHPWTYFCNNYPAPEVSPLFVSVYHQFPLIQPAITFLLLTHCGLTN